MLSKRNFNGCYKEYYISTGALSCFYTLWYYINTPTRSREVYIKNISLNRDDTIAYLLETFEDINTKQEAIEMMMREPHLTCAPKRYANGRMWFGKYRDEHVDNVPVDYLVWMINDSEGDAEYVRVDRKWKQDIIEAAEASAIERGAVRVSKSPYDIESDSTRLMSGDRLKEYMNKVERIEVARETSEHVGVAGQSMDLVLTITEIVRGHGDFGEWRLYKMVDSAGNVFTKFGTISWKFVMDISPDRADLESDEGDMVRFNADIKSHEDYKGVKSTMIGRVRKQSGDTEYTKRWKAVEAARKEKTK